LTGSKGKGTHESSSPHFKGGKGERKRRSKEHPIPHTHPGEESICQEYFFFQEKEGEGGEKRKKKKINTPAF